MAESMPLDGLIQFDATGLIPVIAQDDESEEVLLLAYMNETALRLTLSERVLVLWSRSRGRLWRKGEESGNRLRLIELRLNCEGNSLLARVRLEGSGACHEGYRSCYFRRLEGQPGDLQAIVDRERVFDPASVYGRASNFECDARALYQAYEHLRDAQIDRDSVTSRLLHHDADRAAVCRWALERAGEELAELRGVIAGTHRHRGGRQDVVLEASQVGYWAMIAAVARRIAFDDWRPDLAWLGNKPGKVAPAVRINAFRPEDCEEIAAVLEECRSLLMEAGGH
ncbi:MAG TPA: phosphoribosyl-AMP cyclohydrolase, partial [Thermomicrobiaceae bacterium]|nr:phosphoribosyl-AMP cyclohydrolase [Thermomicrobiaceae bacterium]